MLDYVIKKQTDSSLALKFMISKKRDYDYIYYSIAPEDIAIVEQILYTRWDKWERLRDNKYYLLISLSELWRYSSD